MIKFILYLFFTTLILSQKTNVNVYTGPVLGLLKKLEKDIIINIFELYNNKSKEILTPKFISKNSFSEIFSTIDSLNENHGDAIIISGLSISQERKSFIRFSAPYMNTNIVILKRKKHKGALQRNDLLGYHKDTYYERYAFQLQDSLELTLLSAKPTEKVIQLLYDKKVNFIVDSRFAYVNFPNLEIVQIMPNTSIDQFGIVFPFNSKLYNKLKPICEYYFRSKSFYSLVNKHLGDKYKTFIPFFQKVD